MPREKNMQNVAERQTDAVYQLLTSPDFDAREKLTEISSLFEKMAEAMADDDPQNEKEIKKLAEGFQVLKDARANRMCAAAFSRSQASRNSCMARTTLSLQDMTN